MISVTSTEPNGSGKQTSFRHSPRRRSLASRRTGAMLVMSIVALVAAISFVGFAVDVGMINVHKSRMQATADAVALAAAKEIQVALQDLALDGGDASDVDSVTAYAVARAGAMAVNIANLNGLYLDPDSDLRFGRRTKGPNGTYSNTWGVGPYNLVEATIRKDNTDAEAPDAKLSLFFSPFYGEKTATITATATAFIEARDIVAVLDYSGSMSFDSQMDGYYSYGAVASFGLATVESGLDDIWDALSGSGATFSNDSGVQKFPSTGLGDIDTYGDGYISSNDIHTIFESLDLDGGPGTTTYWYESWNWDAAGSTGYGPHWYIISGGYRWEKYTSGQWSSGVWRINSNMSGSWSNPSDSSSPGYAPPQTTGGDYVPFPQEGRNSNGTLAGKPTQAQSETMWKAYIEWVRDHAKNGYQKKYNYRTLVAYLIEQRKTNSQSEDLWRAPIYPFHSMKEGMTMFTEFLDALDFGDHLGLAIYAETARRETGLWNDSAGVEVDLGDNHMTTEYTKINTIQRHKQAAHYDASTNIGGGILQARQLLNEKGRDDASPVLVVMTDGNANRYDSSFNGLGDDWNWAELTDYDGDGTADYSTSDYAKQYAFQQAKAAIDEGYIIHTLAVGDGADTGLMKAIAFAGNGRFINVPGGTSIAEMREELGVAFMLMAGSVPPGKLLPNSQ